jgi:DNA-binding SARP family transcriptional activator/tetratricopeptide (TPR) repeat protein
MVEFRVLGPLDARAGDEPLPLGGVKQRALLAILLLNANEVVSSDRLIDELWGTETPKTAAKSLQVLVSQLRKVLEPARKRGESGQVLVTRAPGYMLELDPDQFDLERFRRLADEGRAALGAGDPESAAAKLRDALALWRGEPLADLTFASFARTDVSRLEEMRLAALEDRIEADLGRGRHAEVIGELEQLVSKEPLRERPRGQLVLALYRAGRQAAALEVYRDARNALVEQLGIEPGRELKDLHAAILDQDPSLDLPATVTEPPKLSGVEGQSAPDGASGAFVGREHELAEFETQLDGAFTGRTSLLLIAGEPGIGKSRLADECSSVADARGARVIWGRCWEAGGAPAYWPWVQALRDYIREGDRERIRTQLEPVAPDLVQMLPDLRELFPGLGEGPPTGDPEGARFRLFDSTASFLRAAALAEPIVIVIDDLHAADTPSLLLVQFLARSLRDARMVLIGAYRDTETDSGHALAGTVAELRREPVTHAVRLGGLDAAEVAGVIELTSGRPPGAELTAAIHRETEGNPLFVGELVRLLAAEGRLEEAATATALSIPQGLRDVIGHRLHHLSEECKDVLSVASVLGREFRLDALGLVSARSAEELLDLLDEARAARVIGDAPAGRARLRFSHALIRDSLYGDLGTKERLRLHRRAAEALEDLYRDDREPHLAELAYHFVEAARGGEVEKAIGYARRAGDVASASLAYEEAARLYEMGLHALELEPAADEQLRCELLLGLGDAQARGGDLLPARTTFARAADLALRLNAPEQLARAALGYGGRFVWFRAGNDPRLVPLLERALAALPDPGPLRARLLARLAGALRDHPVSERRASLIGEALRIARDLGDPTTLAYALEGSYASLSWPRETQEWLEMGNETIQLARDSGNEEDGFFGHLNVFGVHMVRGDVNSAEGQLLAMTRLAHELRQPVQLWAVSAARAMLALFAGRLEEAERLIALTGETGSRAQGLDATFYYVMHLQAFALRREQGRLDEAAIEFERFVEQYPNFIFRSALASLYCELGREIDAGAELDRLAADGFPDLEVGTEWFFGASLLAEVCASIGAPEHAAPLYEALLPYADFNVYSHIESTRGSAWRPLGLLASAMGRWDEAADHFERAIERNVQMGARPWVAHTQDEYARMLIRRGARDDSGRASELLEAARTNYRELGLDFWEAKASEELASIT